MAIHQRNRWDALQILGFSVLVLVCSPPTHPPTVLLRPLAHCECTWSPLEGCFQWWSRFLGDLEGPGTF